MQACLALGLVACGPPPGDAIRGWEATELASEPAETPPRHVPEGLAFAPVDDLMVRTAGTGRSVWWLRARLGPSDARDPVVLIPRAYIVLAAYVDGELVHSLSDYRRASGVPFHVVPLPHARPVELTLWVASRYSQIGVAPPRVGERAELLTDLAVSDLPRFSAAVALLVVAGFALALAIQRRERRALLGIVVFSLGMASWSLFQTRARQLWMPHLELWFASWWVAGSVVSGGAWFFLASVFDEGPRRSFRALWLFFFAHAVVSAAALSLPEAAFEVSAAPLFLIGRGAAVASTFAALLFLGRESVRGTPYARPLLAGFTAASVGVLHDIGVSAGVIDDGLLLSDVGYLVLGLAMVAIAAQRMRRTEEEAIRHARRIEAFVDERDALMRDLHDGLGGVMANVRLLADRGQREGGEGAVLPTIAELAAEGVSELHGIIGGFDALPATYRELAIELRRAGTLALEGHGVEHRFVSDLEGADLPAPDLARYSALTRIHAEALTNVVKHAGATAVDVRVVATPSQIVLTVDDDGRGPEPKPEGAVRADGSGRGRPSMLARARRVGGTVTVAARERGGTRVELRLPVRGR